MSDNSRQITHFADDDTLRYISQLELENQWLWNAAKRLQNGDVYAPPRLPNQVCPKCNDPAQTLYTFAGNFYKEPYQHCMKDQTCGYKNKDVERVREGCRWLEK